MPPSCHGAAERVPAAREPTGQLLVGLPPRGLPTYTVGMDEVDAPHCPNDDVVMVDVVGGWECPECGHIEQAQDLPLRAESDESTTD